MPDFPVAGIVSHLQIVLEDFVLGEVETPGFMPDDERLGNAGFKKLGTCRTDFTTLLAGNKHKTFRVKGLDDGKDLDAGGAFMNAFGNDFFQNRAPQFLTRVAGQRSTSTARLELISVESTLARTTGTRRGNRRQSRTKIPVWPSPTWYMKQPSRACTVAECECIPGRSGSSASKDAW